MRTLYYECFAGISGDMNLGALVDLGVDFDLLKEELSKLGIDDEFELKRQSAQKMGIGGTKVDVILQSANSHNHNDNNGEHKHPVGHDHTHEHHKHIHHTHGRNYQNIRELINNSQLSVFVKKTSLAIFEKIAIAEAKIHQMSVDDVHFHEVGATDSIVDIVGAAICFEQLNVETIISSPIEVGSGFVDCAHGTYPVPAPATAEILTGIPTTAGKVASEATTPTGAAILATMVDSFPTTPVFVSQKIGYGLGTKNFKIPNVLRVRLGTLNSETKISNQNFIQTKERMIETNIDDMNAEFLPLVEEALFKLGALDVYRTAIQMKKGRSAIKLSVLTNENNAEKISDYILKDTSTFGIRSFVVDKTMLKRRIQSVSTPFGTVNFKEGISQGKVIKFKPEFNDIKTIAHKNNIPFQTVYQKAIEAYEQLQSIT